MDETLTEPRRMSPAERRARAAARTARWREEHAGRPDTRLVDRLLLQSLLHVLVDGDRMTEETAQALEQTTDTAIAALVASGVKPGAAKRAIGRRIAEHRASKTVARAVATDTA